MFTKKSRQSLMSKSYTYISVLKPDDIYSEIKFQKKEIGNLFT